MFDALRGRQVSWHCVPTDAFFSDRNTLPKFGGDCIHAVAVKAALPRMFRIETTSLGFHTGGTQPIALNCRSTIQCAE